MLVMTIIVRAILVMLANGRRLAIRGGTTLSTAHRCLLYIILTSIEGHRVKFKAGIAYIMHGLDWEVRLCRRAREGLRHRMLWQLVIVLCELVEVWIRTV